jgi:hypothetical protein
LLFEIWRPGSTQDKRAALTDIFEAIGTYRGAAIDMGWVFYSARSRLNTHDATNTPCVSYGAIGDRT